jgi:hypothetical protein
VAYHAVAPVETGRLRGDLSGSVGPSFLRSCDRGGLPAFVHEPAAGLMVDKTATQLK